MRTKLLVLRWKRLSIKDHSCNPVRNLEKTGIGLASPPSFDYVESSESKQEFPNVASSNLSENEYEELLRVYRERVW